MAGDEAQYCAQLVRDLDRERWLCALFAPDRVRPAILALLAFDLEIARVRAAVREPHMALIRLQWWRETLDSSAAGAPRRHPVCVALASVLAEAPGVRPLLAAAIDARELDVMELPFAESGDLLAYADATGGGLARAIAAATGAADQTTVAAAAALGRGWSLTGLLGAAPHLAARRWCPLPAACLREHGVEHELWLAGRPGPCGPAAAAAVARLARDSFDAAGRERTRALGLALGGLRVLGQARLRRLERAGHDVFAPELAQPMTSAAPRLAAAWALRRW